MRAFVAHGERSVAATRSACRCRRTGTERQLPLIARCPRAPHGARDGLAQDAGTFEFSEIIREIILFELWTKCALPKRTRAFKARLLGRVRMRPEQSRGDIGQGHVVPVADGILAGRRPGAAAERRHSSRHRRSQVGAGEAVSAAQRRCQRHAQLLRRASPRPATVGSQAARGDRPSRRRPAPRCSTSSSTSSSARSETDAGGRDRHGTVAEHADAHRSRAGLARPPATPRASDRRSEVRRSCSRPSERLIETALILYC